MVKYSNKKMLQHARQLTKAEIEAFSIIVQEQLDTLVLVPVVINGQDRFGLARVSKTSEGFQVKVVAIIVMPSDKLCLDTGEEVALVIGDDDEEIISSNQYLN